jgi:hypothetical protein
MKSFEVISCVKMDLVSIVSETASVSFIRVLCDEWHNCALCLYPNSMLSELRHSTLEQNTRLQEHTIWAQIQGAATSLITSVLNDGDRDTLRIVGHKLHLHMADYPRDFTE